jgi:nucleoside-diphosphate-sugar epimerase/predicted dehydrogenase
MKTPVFRTAIVGAGFISDFHFDAINRQNNSQLVAVCDFNESAAKRLAMQGSDVEVYSDLHTMLQTAELDIVHILTQPDSHFSIAKSALEAGCHVIIEKPATSSLSEAQELLDIASVNKLRVAINHNFVFSRPFSSLRETLEAGTLGPLKSVRIVWKKKLPQLNSGPWNLWMLREPGNILFETGSHSLSELLAVVSEPSIVSVDARRPKVLPSGSVFFRRWNICADSNGIDIKIDASFDLGYEQHSVEVEGLFGVARADIENDVFILDSPTGRAYDSERLFLNVYAGMSRSFQACKTYSSYIASKFLSAASGGPYDSSMRAGIANCYAELVNNSTRAESSLKYAIEIARAAEAVQSHLPKEPIKEPIVHQSRNSFSDTPELNAEVLIVGASGFIGRRLLVALQERGVRVRAIVRNSSSLSGVAIGEGCEIVVGDFRNQDFISKVLVGIDTVVHLAVNHGNSLESYIKADVEPTKAFIDQCQVRGIKRFIYTGTIDSLYLGPGAGVLRETDGVDTEIKRRNNYARSKSMVEAYLRQCHKVEGFPCVIIRPAIVLGSGGPVTHVGVANWSGLGFCSFWGDGNNKLPLVLVDDVVDALVKSMETEGIEGRTYNLSSKSCISAQEYVNEVEDVLGSKITRTHTHYMRHYFVDLIKWLIKIPAGHPDSKRFPSVRDWRCREQHASFNTQKAETELGWKPQNDRDTIVEIGIREPTRLFLDS